MVDLQGLYCPLCKTKTTVLLWLVVVVVVVVGQSEDESRRTDLSQRPFWQNGVFLRTCDVCGQGCF